MSGWVSDFADAPDCAAEMEECPSSSTQTWPIQSDTHTSVQPGSRVTALSETIPATTFTVNWSGSPAGLLYGVQVRVGALLPRCR